MKKIGFKGLVKKGYVGLGVLMIGMAVVGCTSVKIVSTPASTSDSKAEEKVEVAPVELSISAAASLKEAMAGVAEAYGKVRPEVTLTINFGSSGSLQKQIEEGAPCDLFISAGQKQMKSLQDEGLMVEDTLKSVVKNELVLIAPEESTLTTISDITTDQVGKLAIGEPGSVPAGKYAQEVLESLEMAERVKEKIVMAKDVKEVFAWVQTGNADAGFVYQSDTVGKEGIKIVETTLSESHTPIIYPMGVPKQSKEQEEAIAFESFLLTEEAQAIFKKKGYAPAS